MNEITIMVNDRIAAANGTVYVCGNSDYTARFVFSPQWEDLPIRTARFVKVTREGTESHVDVLFQGDSCPVPNFLDAAWIYVGVFAGDRRTTTPARIRARRSILDQGGPPEEPRPDVYARILEEMNRMETALEAAVGPLTEPREGDLPTVWFGAPLAQTKEETVMSFRYVSKTRDIAGYCKTKAQGNHSLQYPKKNQTVKLYADPDCTEPLKVDFKGWGEQSKYCFKANWIDLTHARNIVSARLWGDVVEARADCDSLPEELRTSPNRGAVDGFPVKVFAGGVYQGRYTVNIPKDPWMANMDEDLDTHCILCGENYVSGCFRAEAVMDGTDWTDEVHDTVPDAIRTRWNEVISFVMTSSDEAFRQGLGGYFDVQSLLDYYLFGVAACGLDNFGKNQLYMTWDGQTWFASMYDLDATWGNWYNGQAFVSAEYSRNEYQDFADGEGNLLYIRLAALFPEELQARWAELRQGPLSADHILRRFEAFTSLCPPWLTEEDYAAATGDGTFTAIPGQGTNNIQQIRAYVLARLGWADGHVADLTADPLLYALPEATVFDGVDDCIDTGVALMDEARDFTILLDMECTDQSVVQCAVFHCMSGPKDYPGISLMSSGSTVNFFLMGYQPGVEPAHSNQTLLMWRLIRRIAVVYQAGVPVLMKFTKTDGSANSVTLNPDPVFTAVPQTMLLGASRSVEGTPWRYWKGTLHEFSVYGYAMDEAQVDAYLAA